VISAPSKMPKAKTKPRRDNTDFTEYKKGGKVKPVWEKPRPKQLGKPSVLSAVKKAAAKSRAKGCWPALSQRWWIIYGQLGESDGREMDPVRNQGKGGATFCARCKKGKNIPAGKLAAAAKKPGKMGQRARLAETLGKLRKK
jgi:hypothetical protein